MNTVNRNNFFLIGFLSTLMLILLAFNATSAFAQSSCDNGQICLFGNTVDGIGVAHIVLDPSDSDWCYFTDHPSPDHYFCRRSAILANSITFISNKSKNCTITLGAWELNEGNNNYLVVKPGEQVNLSGTEWEYTIDFFRIDCD